MFGRVLVSLAGVEVEGGVDDLGEDGEDGGAVVGNVGEKLVGAGGAGKAQIRVEGEGGIGAGVEVDAAGGLGAGSAAGMRGRGSGSCLDAIRPGGRLAG